MDSSVKVNTQSGEDILQASDQRTEVKLDLVLSATCNSVFSNVEEVGQQATNHTHHTGCGRHLFAEPVEELAVFNRSNQNVGRSFNVCDCFSGQSANQFGNCKTVNVLLNGSCAIEVYVQFFIVVVKAQSGSVSVSGSSLNGNSGISACLSCLTVDSEFVTMTCNFNVTGYGNTHGTVVIADESSAVLISSVYDIKNRVHDRGQNAFKLSLINLSKVCRLIASCPIAIVYVNSLNGEFTFKLCAGFVSPLNRNSIIFIVSGGNGNFTSDGFFGFFTIGLGVLSGNGSAGMRRKLALQTKAQVFAFAFAELVVRHIVFSRNFKVGYCRIYLTLLNSSFRSVNGSFSAVVRFFFFITTGNKGANQSYTKKQSEQYR